MRRSTNQSNRKLQVSALFVIGWALAFAHSHAAAADPDIPKTEAGMRHVSVKDEIQFGAAYLAGRGRPQDLAQAAYWYERAANAGDPLAQNEIGYFYQVGIGVPKDLQRAALWYQRSADGGFLKARVNLGIAYFWGIGVRQDTQLGYKLIHDAADKNCGLADAYLGEIYNFGLSVPVDRRTARDWYARGARFNDSLAQFRLAAMLMEGNPPRQDLLKAAKLLRQSIRGGYVAAQHSLGLLMVNHPDLRSQPGEAVSLLQNASEAGIWKSSAILGAVFRDGKGASRDYARAYFYFLVAELQGGETAHATVKTDLAILSHELTSDETAKLSEQADEWIKQHPLTLQFMNKDTGSSDEFPVFAISAANDDSHVGKLIPAPQNRAQP